MRKDMINSDNSFKDDDKKVVIAAVVTSLVIILGIIVGMCKYIGYLSDNKLIAVPDLVSENYDEVKEEWEKKGLTIDVVGQEISKKYPKGVILSQSIEPKKKVSKNTIIEVITSKGNGGIVMPDLQARTLSEAREVLDRYGVIVNTQLIESEQLDAGYIVKTVPEYNTALKKGQTVTLYISNGNGKEEDDEKDDEENEDKEKETDNKDAKVTVPTVIGMSEKEAKAKLDKNDLKVGNITNKTGASSSSVIVATQSPKAGTKVASGSKINLVMVKDSIVTTGDESDDDNDQNDNDDDNDNQVVSPEPITQKITVQVAPSFEMIDSSYQVQIVMQDSKGTSKLYQKTHGVEDFPFSKQFMVENGSYITVYVGDQIVNEYQVK